MGVPASDSSRLVSLMRTNRPLEADTVRDLLLARGIGAMARPTGMPPGLGAEFYALDMTRAEVCVYAGDLPAAQAVLAELAPDVAALADDLLPESSPASFQLARLSSGLPRGLLGGLTALGMLLALPFLLLVELGRAIHSAARRRAG